MYLDDCVCVLSDLTWLPLLGAGRKSWYIIINYIIGWDFMHIYNFKLIVWFHADQQSIMIINFVFPDVFSNLFWVRHISLQLLFAIQMWMWSSCLRTAPSRRWTWGRTLWSPRATTCCHRSPQLQSDSLPE